MGDTTKSENPRKTMKYLEKNMKIPWKTMEVKKIPCKAMQTQQKTMKTYHNIEKHGQRLLRPSTPKDHCPSLHGVKTSGQLDHYKMQLRLAPVRKTTLPPMYTPIWSVRLGTTIFTRILSLQRVQHSYRNQEMHCDKIRRKVWPQNGW